MIFLTFKIYRMINKPFEDYDGVFQSVEAAAATAAIMILLGAYARLGTDEMWDVRNLFTLVTGFVAYAGSVVCLILLLVDMTAASHDIEGGYLQRSFFYAWIGYPLVGMVGVGYRLGMACFSNKAYAGEIPEAISVFKARRRPHSSRRWRAARAVCVLRRMSLSGCSMLGVRVSSLYTRLTSSSVRHCFPSRAGEAQRRKTSEARARARGRARARAGKPYKGWVFEYVL